MKLLRHLTGIVVIIIAVNAIGGGLYGMMGAEGVPLDLLKGSPFKNYFIPGLFLFLVIGEASIVTGIGMFRNKRWAFISGIATAFLLLAWIAIQLLIVGYVSWLQPAVLITALFIGGTSMYLKRKSNYRH